MNSLKPLFIVAVLAAVGYGVYVSINRKSTTDNTLEEAPRWGENPTAQIPGPEVATPTFPNGATTVTPAPTGQYTGGTPAFAPGAGAADPGGGPLPYPTTGQPGTSGGPNSPGTMPPPGNSLVQPGFPSSGTPPASAPSADTPPTNIPPAGTPAANTSGDWFTSYLQAVQAKIDEGSLAEAQLVLSKLYDDPRLLPGQSSQVNDLLNKLAGSVIYSRQHLLAQPHTVKQGETLPQIAEQYGVPWQLLGKINFVRDPANLTPGQQLKVVRGPFEARIRLQRRELTLFLDGRFAGTFPIGIGTDVDRNNLEGTYIVCEKKEDPAYYGSTGTVAGGDPRNPYGRLWLGLGQQIGEQTQLGIHGTNDPLNLHGTTGRGAIRMSNQDIEDVFGILSVGSHVEILR